MKTPEMMIEEMNRLLKVRYHLVVSKKDNIRLREINRELMNMQDDLEKMTGKKYEVRGINIVEKVERSYIPSFKMVNTRFGSLNDHKTV